MVLGAGVDVMTGTPILGCFEDLRDRLTTGAKIALLVGMEVMLDREKLKELECTVEFDVLVLREVPTWLEPPLLKPRISYT